MVGQIQKWDIDQILAAVDEELYHARDKFPNWSADQVHNAAIVGEETGELIRAALQYYYEYGSLKNCDFEAIQVIATAIRFLMRS